MSEFRYSIDWNDYVKQIESLKEIDENRRGNLAKSINTLRHFLGEKWLLSMRQTNHPILWSLRTISGGSSDFLLLLWANCFSSLENVRGFGKLLKRIGKEESFESAITELELASRLVTKGCSLEIEPVVGNKHPDLLCKIYDNIEFLIEVKTSKTAKETKKANKTAREIMSACNPIFPAGIIFKPLSTPHLKKVKSILQEKTKIALEKKADEEVNIPNVLKIYLVSEEDQNRIKKYKDWYDKQGSLGIIPKGSHGLLGPSDGVRQEYRVRIRLDALQREKQIPAEKMGIIVIVSDFRFWTIEDVSEFVDVIIESVYELTNITAVILWSTKVIADGQTNVTEKEDFIFIENYLFGEIKEDIVIIKNRFCKMKFDYEVLKNLLVINNN